MVRWFDPAQLMRTGIKSLVSLAVGEQSDRRIVQALAARRHEDYDHSIHYRDGAHGPVPRTDAMRDELWVDVACDTGDGFNPTYAVAYAIAQPALTIDGPTGQVVACRAATCSCSAATRSTRCRAARNTSGGSISPYTAAFGDDTPAERPHVYAVPGNHDWYDGLSAFTRLFCSDIGGRRSPAGGPASAAATSPSSCRTDGGWCGSDGQLQSDLDVPQIEHFREIAARHMQPGDKVILCLSTPVWVYAHKYRDLDRVFDETDLIYLREEIFAKRGVRVACLPRPAICTTIAATRRRRRRRPAQPPVQKIIAGGGGAFLHPTHEEDVSLLARSRRSPRTRAPAPSR